MKIVALLAILAAAAATDVVYTPTQLQSQITDLPGLPVGANFKVRKGGVQMKEGREMGRGARAFKGQLPAPKEERAFGLGGVLPPKRERNTAGGGQGVGERIARELFKS